MMEETEASQNIQANDNSVAVGNVNVGGSIGGDLTIGNTYNYSTSEDNAPISSEEYSKACQQWLARNRGKCAEERQYFDYLFNH